MHLEWSPQQLEIRERFRQFARTEIAPGAARRDREGSFDHDLWKRLADTGLWRLLRRREPGGDPGALWDFLAAFEGLSSAAEDFGLIMSVIAHAGLLEVLLQHGTEAQRREQLQRLMSGSVGATAATEPGGGSHIANLKTAATPVEGGYVLTGDKVHITNAPIADHLLIVGRIPSLGRQDITLFLVARGQPGVALGPGEDLLGQRSSPTGPIELRDARVTAADFVGEPGNGLATLYSFLSFDRLMYGIAVAGVLEPVIERAMARISSRIAFGVPLAEHEYIQEKLVDMKLTMETSRWLAYSAAAELCRANPASSMQASLAKLAASEGMVRAGLELIQLFGHEGYDRASGIERVLRDATALRLAGGTTEMQKKNIFKHLSLSTLGPQHHAKNDGSR